MADEAKGGPSGNIYPGRADRWHRTAQKRARRFQESVKILNSGHRPLKMFLSYI